MTEPKDRESRARESTGTGGWSQYPADRGHPGRQRRLQRREHATGLLSRYLDQVASAVRAEGLTVVDARIRPGPDLEAQLQLRPTHHPHTGADTHSGVPTGAQHHNGTAGIPVSDCVHGTVEPFELFWAEDTGWHIEHHLLGGPSQATPWRYLHTELVPAPAAVARFTAAVLAGINTIADEIGMLYPAQFRFRSQPLGPVLDALARHTTPPTDTIDGVSGQAMGEPVTDAVTRARAKGAG
jgi:Family of unknown function (DUF6292)